MPERQAGFLDNPLIRLNGRQGGLNMGFMETMQAKMDATLVPVASKLNGQRHVAAVRDAFTLAFPLTLAGSIITLVNFAVLSPDGFIAKILHLGSLIPNLADYQKIFTPILNGTTNIMSVLIVFLTAYKLAEVLGKDVSVLKERMLYNFAGGR
jgi:PTS system cellobiose-specific IIC component